MKKVYECSRSFVHPKSSVDDLNHDLSTPKCWLWKNGNLGSLSPSLSLEVEDGFLKSSKNPNPIKVYL